MAKTPGLAFYLALKRRQSAPKDGPRPDGPLVWLHAATETEAIACLELIERLREDRDELRFLLTVASPSTREAVTESCPPGTEIDLLTGDDPAVADRWRPDAVAWTKSASHPAILSRLQEMGIPMILADAAVPSGPRPLMQRLPGVQRALLSGFDKILARNPDVERWLRAHSLGPDIVEVLGDMQEGTVALPCNEAERDSIARTLAARPVWLAANCTVQEEALVLAAHRAAMRSAHRLLLVVVPDNPTLGPAMTARFERAGLNAACRSEAGEPEEEIQVYVADIKNELGLWYRLAPISFLGRSLGPGGGVNPYQAAALGSAILHGPEVSRHAAGFSRLARAGAARLVRNAEELGSEVKRLQAPDQAALMAHAAWQLTSGGSQVIDRLAELLSEMLDQRQADQQGAG